MFDEAKNLSDEKFELVSGSFMIEREEIIEKEEKSAKSILSDVKIKRSKMLLRYVPRSAIE